MDERQRPFVALQGQVVGAGMLAAAALHTVLSLVSNKRPCKE